MNCQNCGANVDGMTICPRCGSAVEQGSPTKVLVFGIIGLALSETGLLGLIFSIIAMVQANGYINKFGDNSQKVRIGKRLGIAGLIISIIVMVIWIALIAFLIVVAVNTTPEGWERVASEVSRLESIVI